jgi:transcriptional regulator with XRE-family HTH domain
MAELKTLFGAMVRKHRTRRKLSQIALSEKAGLSLETVARVERGESGASFETVEKIAAALDVRPAAMFGVDPENPQDDAFERLVIALARMEPKRVAWVEAVLAAVLAKPT